MRTIVSIPGCQERKELSIADFRQNSQEVNTNDLFFALRGKKVDGHTFLSEVAERGAIAAVVDKNYQGKDFGLFLFRSHDVIKSLQVLAKESLTEDLVLVGITGSAGKTTTKEFLATLLERKFRLEKSPGSRNSQVSLPLNLLNRSGNEELLVLEMGMSKSGEIAQLVEIAPPDFALITKITRAHIAHFKEGLLGIAKAKSEILSHPKTKIAVIPHQLLDYLIPKKNYCTFSLDQPSADFFLSVEEKRMVFWEKRKREISFPLLFAEKHFQEDFLAALALSRVMGLSWQEIEERIAFLRTPRMRFEKWEHDGILYINDAYNAHPESVLAALQSLPLPKEGGKIIAVLGEMADQGIFSEENHREIGRSAALLVDHLLCYGKETIPMWEAFSEKKKNRAEIFFDKRELFQRLSCIVRKNDVVLVKGKRGCELDELFSWMNK